MNCEVIMNDNEVPATQHDSTGFNYNFGKTWSYPTNLPVRKYQKDIVAAALFTNTMVCLPTGLGKTFIAAVVMHNFYRWYPSGKIVFMATTKPLVKQQIDACYNIVAIPKVSTAELTGSVIKQNREDIWKTKRVFFLTPQVLANDLDSIDGICGQIKCLVIDEAHRARGNHAYCEVIKKLQQKNIEFRVLALTATPASSVLDVITVCRNLLVAHLEIRTEQSDDVKPYIHQKSIETIVLKFEGKLLDVLNAYKYVLDKQVRILVQHKVLQSGMDTLHKGRIFYLTKEYEERNASNRGTLEYKLVTKVLSICAILYHGYDVLTRHGMRSFAQFFDEHIDKPLLMSCAPEVKEIIADIKTHVGAPLNYERLPSGTKYNLPENCVFGHPKFYRLAELVEEHFRKYDRDSKVIVFAEYVHSVTEASAILSSLPGVRVKTFMGKSALTQKQQMCIIDSFRSGECNTLVSTCIGEEGIDVGFVDLVVCFDISNKSAVRLVQRMGRTGRDRAGHVVYLVTEGKEHQVLKDCLREMHNMIDTLIMAKDIDDRLYANSPRMLPAGLTPECQELFIVPIVSETVPTAKPSTSRKKDANTTSIKQFFTPLKPVVACIDLTKNRIPESKLSCLSQEPERNDNQLNFCKNLDKQRDVKRFTLGASTDSMILSDLLKFVEYKRYNIPIKNETSSKVGNAKKKQVDIREMFKASTQSVEPVAVKNSQEEYESLVESKINAIVANYEDCVLCETLDDQIAVKSELVPINPNYLKCDLTSIQEDSVKELLKKFKPEENVDSVLFDDDFPINDLTCIETPKKTTSDASMIKNNLLQALSEMDNTCKPEVSEDSLLDHSAKRSRSPAENEEEDPAKRSRFELCDIFDVTCQRKAMLEVTTSVLRVRTPSPFKNHASFISDDLIDSSSENEFERNIPIGEVSVVEDSAPSSSDHPPTQSSTQSDDRFTAADIFDLNIREEDFDQSQNLASYTTVETQVAQDETMTNKPPGPGLNFDLSDIFEFSSATSSQPPRTPTPENCDNASPIQSPVLKPRRRRRQRKELESPTQKKKRSKAFVLSQAEVSGSTLASSDEHSEDNAEDAFDASFVDDATQEEMGNETHMQAVYVESVRSPKKRPLLRNQQAMQRMDVFSQMPVQDATYVRDSFVVGSDHESSGEEHEDELEVAEQRLATMRRAKKEQRKEEEDVFKMPMAKPRTNSDSKWRRIVIENSDSD